MNSVEGKFKKRVYFSSIRNYTLALLESFKNINYWVEKEDQDTQIQYNTPISFGNYDKAVMLQDLSESEIKKGNYNFVPRLVLSFEGMTKASDRQTNKFNKFTKKVFNEKTGRPELDVSYNSLAYDFHFTLLLQSRGLTIASQITEEILIKFNPSLNLLIEEFPLFDKQTETQILISDPAFEIQDEQDELSINLINVTFDITIRGNIYSHISLEGPIEVVNMFFHLWDKKEREKSKLAAFYKFDIDQETHKVYRQTERHFDGSIPYNDKVGEPIEKLIKDRPDYNPPEVIQEFPENIGKHK